MQLIVFLYSENYWTNILFYYYSFAFISTDPSLPGEPE